MKFARGSLKQILRRGVAFLPIVLAFAIITTLAAPGRARPQSNSSSAPTPALRVYAGTWKASFQGKVFAILVLRVSHGSLEGTLNNFEVAYDKHGNLTRGTHIDIGVSPIISPRFKDGALIFTVAQKDAYSQTTDWSFVVKNGHEGELTEILANQLEAPMSMAVKPIRMFRDSRR